MGNLHQLNVNEPLAPSYALSSESHWYAVYTCAQHEKSVVKQLELRSIECFLPLYERVSRWKDRHVRLLVPLFSGYVFVRIKREEKLRVLQIPGIVRLVGFNGHPVALPDDDISSLRFGLRMGQSVEPHSYLTTGTRVRISSGPFEGLHGVLKARKNGLRVVVALELIQQAVVVDVEASQLLELKGNNSSTITWNPPPRLPSKRESTIG